LFILLALVGLLVVETLLRPNLKLMKYDIYMTFVSGFVFVATCVGLGHWWQDIVYHHGNLHHHDKNFNFCVVVVLTLLTGQTRHRLRNRESKVCVHCRTLREYFILIRYLISYDHGISITITIIMIFVYVLTLSTGLRRQRL